MALARMIASLHDDDGEVAVEGLSTFAWEGIDVTEEEFRAETGVYPEVRLLGSGSIAERTLSKPSINVLAFDAPRTNEVANQIVPTATAVVGLRMAPGEDYPRAAELVANHLRAAAPWGVRVDDRRKRTRVPGYLVDTSSPTFTAAREALQGVFEHEVVEIGSGGSIPLVPVLADDVPGDRGPDVGSRRRHVELPLAQRERGSRRGRAHGAGRGGVPRAARRAIDRPTARLDP